MNLSRALSALLILAVAACSDQPRSIPLVSGGVDTFEDGNHLNNVDLPWEAIAEGAGTRAGIEVQPGGFFNVSKHHLEVVGVRPEGTGGSSVAGVRTSIADFPPAADPSREPIPRDVTGYDGLALSLRGTPGTYIIQLGSASVKDFDNYNAYVEVSDDWAEYRLPFSSFRQEGFGTPIPWTGRDAIHVAVFANLEGYFDFGIDDVRFYQN